LSRRLEKGYWQGELVQRDLLEAEASRRIKAPARATTTPTHQKVQRLILSDEVNVAQGGRSCLAAVWRVSERISI